MALTDSLAGEGTRRSPRFWIATRRICQVAIAISFGWLIATAWQPIRLNWGDPWSDIDIMTAGRFMADDGFVATRFTPIVDIKPLDEHSYRYVHYPPLAEIINGTVQKVTGSDSLAMFRLLFVGFSALSVLFLFRYVRRIWGERVAWVASALFATNSLWLKYADCIHSHPLHLMTGFGALASLTRWIDDRRRRDLAIFLAWCAAAFMSSYDYYLFLPIMVIATPWLMGHRFRSRLTLEVMGLGALGCGAGLALKCGLAIWALGWGGFVTDLHFQFLERATGALSTIVKHFPAILFFRHYRFFSPVFYVVLGVGVASVFVPRLRPYVGTPSPWVLLGAGLLFIVAMRQLFCEQYHVSLSLLPWFAVASAVMFVRAVEHRVGMALALAGAAVCYGWHVKEVATFDYAFLDADELVPVRAELDGHDGNGFLYSTLSYTPSFRYSLNRHMISIDWVEPSQLASYFEWQTRDLGGVAPYFIHHAAAVAAAEDPKVTTFYTGVFHKMWWLRDPWWSRADRRRRLRQRFDAQLAVVATVADKILVSGAFTLYRIDPVKLRDVLYPRPTTVPAIMTADSPGFARAASVEPSITAPGKLGDRTVRYSFHYRPYRLLITVGTGSSRLPPKQPPLDFALRLPQDLAHDQTARMTVIPLVAGTRLRVLGDRPQEFVLGPVGTPQVVEVTMPARGGEARIDEVEERFDVDKIDDNGHGIAIETIELEAVK